MAEKEYQVSLMTEPQQSNWTPWTFEEVVDVTYPAFALRTYLEQRDVRSYFSRISSNQRIGSACEIGCGFGRMTVVLSEFASHVVGFERQPEFVDEARRLHPDIEIHRINSLDTLPVANGAFDVVLTFTVLQHLIDAAAVRAIGEIKRILRPSGFVLLCEETDTNHLAGDLTDEHGRCTIGRSVTKYTDLFAPTGLSPHRRAESNPAIHARIPERICSFKPPWRDARQRSNCGSHGGCGSSLSPHSRGPDAE
jgi:SAM-dependent methyltransferase